MSVTADPVALATFPTVKAAREIAGSLSKPSKMPGHGYGLPADRCAVGGRLRAVEGSVCHGCYAMGGNYRWPSVRTAQEHRLEAVSHPLWEDAMVRLISHYVDPADPFFRWHDSGDIQSLAHLERIARIAERLPEVRFWIPTREYAFVREYNELHGAFPPNLTVRKSAHMVNMSPSQRGLESGDVFSMVTSTGDTPDGAWLCPSLQQDNACGDCRTCWDSTAQVVAYRLH